MNTLKQTLAQSNIDPKLIRAVVAQVGKDYLEDLARHGAAGGFPGITYTRDTVAFFKKHRGEIAALVENMASDFGENPVDFVAGFQCLGGSVKAVNQRQNHQEFYPSVSRCLYGGRLTDEDDTVANALCWFACEEVARAFNPNL